MIGGHQDRWIAICTTMRFHTLVGCGNPVKPADPSRGAWSRYEAWQDLICEASWKQRQVINKGRTILLERGQVMAARSWLASRWNWTEKQVRGFLFNLESEAMISLGNTNSGLVENNRELGPAKGQQKGPANGQQEGQQKGQQKSNLIAVLSICNYDIYQTARELDALTKGQQKAEGKSKKWPARGQQKGPDLLQGTRVVEERTEESLSRESLSFGRNEISPDTKREPCEERTEYGGYYANGSAYVGIVSNFRLNYNDVVEIGKENGFTADEAHEQAHVAARHWSDKRIDVEHPSQRFAEGLRTVNARKTSKAQQAVDIWNEAAQRLGLPLVRALNPARAKAITLRIKEVGGMDGFKHAVGNLDSADWCLGKNDSGWKADFDWLCQPKSFHKLNEGGYSRGERKPKRPAGRPGR